MKRAAVYVRVSTVDQHPETQLHDLRQFAAQRWVPHRAGVHGSRLQRDESSTARTGRTYGRCPPITNSMC